MFNKKAIGPVIAIALLVVVSLVAVIGFQSWYGSYSSQLLVKAETDSQGTSNTNIETLIGDQLYFKNTFSDNVSIKQIKIGDRECNVSMNITTGVHNISLGSCVNNLTLDSSIGDIVVITERQIYTKKHLFKDFTLSNSSLVSNPIVEALYSGNDANTVLLIQSDGTYGIQKFRNVASPYPVFNQSYGYFDGTDDWLSTPDSIDFDLGSGDFTIDFWANFESQPLTSGEGICLISHWQTAGGGNKAWRILYQHDSGSGENEILLDWSTDGLGENRVYANWTGTLNTWYHFAFIRGGDEWKIFVDGIQVGNTQIVSGSIYNSVSPLEIGILNVNSNEMQGNLDEIRISKGIARWTSNFPVPTSPHTKDANDVLLLHFDNGEGSTSFIDSSDSAHTITRNGDAIQKDVIQVNGDVKHKVLYVEPKFGNSSGYFDGVGDYLSIPDSNDFNFGIGDFTFDFWIYKNLDGEFSIINKDYYTAGENGNWKFATLSDGSVVFATYDATSNLESIISPPGLLNSGQWHHVALTREGIGVNQTKIYVDGGEVASGRISKSLGQGSGSLYVSRRNDASNTENVNGYLDELRISKGVARWTSNFSVPTLPHTTDGNDVLLLNFDEGFGSQSFTDTTGRHTITSYGDTKQTSKRFNSNFSASFDGDGDYLTVPASQGFNFSNEDFTIDLWVYPVPGSGKILQQRDGGAWLSIDISDYAGKWGVIAYDSSAYYGSYDSVPIDYYEWTHLALVRNGANIYAYLNGKEMNPGSASTNVGSNEIRSLTTPLHIGIDDNFDDYEFNGSIDELRISKGIARWTADFIPLTESYLQDSYTSLLLHFEPETNYSNFIDSSSNNHQITRHGNTIITRNYPFNDSAIYFDGVGDYLVIPDSDDWNFGSDNFTIDFWFNPTTFNYASYGTLMARYVPANFELLIDKAGTIYWYMVGMGTQIHPSQTIIPSINKWYHLALVRENDNFMMFVNGKLVGNRTSSLPIADTSQPLSIGARSDGNLPYQGYIDELRISKGIVRWNSTFLPPGGPYK